MERLPVIGDKFCLTPEHEVLTTNGWKGIDKVTLEDTVACLNDKEEIYYSKPSKSFRSSFFESTFSCSNLLSTVTLSLIK